MRLSAVAVRLQQQSADPAALCCVYRRSCGRDRQPFPATEAIALVAFCPCMVLVPGPHILNGAIDLARTRIALGIARLAYAGVIVLLICAGGLFGFTAAGGNLAIATPSPPVPLIIDVIAAGCAVASFGTFFSTPWRLLAFPIAAGMLAHAARWA